ncbi:CLUMA_CG005588, isoform A [Clunio marinus]|uniref:CLUMA_CG005588, isoform A n=1 Tax=Clunio marinus TaxID=568069 RepID=A0A1J1HVA7_9DIPT|nr:CLUMA_CG005588, isoform A [Clunio marinus]
MNFSVILFFVVIQTILATPFVEDKFLGDSELSKDGSGYVTVPYTFDDSAGYSEVEKMTIVEGLEQLAAKTCIKFVLRTDESDYIEIMNGNGCSSYLECVKKGNAMHDFFDGLGCSHMHSLDRDQYLTVNFDEVPAEKSFNYAMINDDEIPADEDETIDRDETDYYSIIGQKLRIRIKIKINKICILSKC